MTETSDKTDELEELRPRGSSTICLPLLQEEYERIIKDPVLFRQALDQAFLDMPELFPSAFGQGYTLKDSRCCRKLGVTLRRIECKASGEAFTVRPSFILPYATGYTADVANALFLRKWGVPFWALTHVFGRDDMY